MAVSELTKPRPILISRTFISGRSSGEALESGNRRLNYVTEKVLQGYLSTLIESLDSAKE